MASDPVDLHRVPLGEVDGVQVVRVPELEDEPWTRLVPPRVVFTFGMLVGGVVVALFLLAALVVT